MTPHPDIEQLSAHLDNEDGPEEAALVSAHLEACASCRDRLGELEAVSRMVASPVTGPAAREEAIARALAAAAPAAPTWPSGVMESPPGRITPPTPITAGHGVRATQAGHGVRATQAGRKDKESRWRWVMAGSIAAALTLVVATVALVSTSKTEDDTTTALNAEAGGLEGTTTVPGADSAVDGGFLGDFADTSSLRARVNAATGEAATSGGAPAPARSAGPTFAAPAAPGLASDQAAPPQPAPAPKQIGTRPCEIEARTANPQLGIIVYSATARYQGTPALVLGFAPAPGSGPVTLLVLAQDGCRSLAPPTTS